MFQNSNIDGKNIKVFLPSLPDANVVWKLAILFPLSNKFFHSSFIFSLVIFRLRPPSSRNPPPSMTSEEGRENDGTFSAPSKEDWENRRTDPNRLARKMILVVTTA